ncbi:hypothetical protein BD413DRAFT_309056 [Trametes elegans]|nr:hypothetical protein BD413DRAFT_309056 [Trametes elegans]
MSINTLCVTPSPRAAEPSRTSFAARRTWRHKLPSTSPLTSFSNTARDLFHRTPFMTMTTIWLDPTKTYMMFPLSIGIVCTRYFSLCSGARVSLNRRSPHMKSIRGGLEILFHHSYDPNRDPLLLILTMSRLIHECGHMNTLERVVTGNPRNSRHQSCTSCLHRPSWRSTTQIGCRSNMWVHLPRIGYDAAKMLAAAGPGEELFSTPADLQLDMLERSSVISPTHGTPAHLPSSQKLRMTGALRSRSVRKHGVHVLELALSGAGPVSADGINARSPRAV